MTTLLKPSAPANPNDFPRATKLLGVKVNYARFDPARPVDAYMSAGKQWECQVIVPTKEQAQELADKHLRVKVNADGTYSLNLKRKTVTSKGGDNSPVRVVDCGDKAKGIAPQPFTDVNSIGNGSTCNISVYQFHYEMAGVGKGVSEILSAVQVVDLVPYSNTGTDDFDMVDGYTQQSVTETTVDDEIMF